MTILVLTQNPKHHTDHCVTTSRVDLGEIDKTRIWAHFTNATKQMNFSQPNHGGCERLPQTDEKRTESTINVIDFNTFERDLSEGERGGAATWV